MLGRAVQTTATDGSHPATYLYLDLETQVTDGNGHMTSTSYDLWGRAVEVDPSAGPGVTYTYDEADNLLTAVRGGATTLLTYDKAGRKLMLDDPDMGDWTYTYDALGNLLTQTDARGCITTLSYDGLNRLTGKVYSGACNATHDVEYRYDEAGGVYGEGYRTKMTDASGSTTWKYDTRGRVTGEVKAVTGSGTFKTQWSYNSNDSIAWMKYPADNAQGIGEQVIFSYHPQGSLNSMINNATTPPPYT